MRQWLIYCKGGLSIFLSVTTLLQFPLTLSIILNKITIPYSKQLAMTKNIKKLFALCCALILTLLVFAKPTLAANFPPSSYGSSYKNPTEFLKQCVLSQPDSGIGEVLCSVGKDGAKVVIAYVLATGACYLADGAAASAFPPAIALAPFCNTVGVGSAGAGATIAGGRVIGKVLAH